MSDPNPDEFGKTLTKEEYESIIENHDFVERPPCSVTMVTDSEHAKQVWYSIYGQILKTGETIRSSIPDAVRKWKKAKFQSLALLHTDETKDLKAIALLSLNVIGQSYFVELMMTLTPIAEQPYVKMLIKTLDQIAIENGSSIIIPKRYRNFTDDILEATSDQE